MRPNHRDGMKALTFVVLIIVGAYWGVPNIAGASTVICSDRAAHKYNYGQKQVLNLLIPADERDSFGNSLNSYGSEKGLAVTTVSTGFPNTNGAYRDYILQSDNGAGDVTIKIRVRDNDTVALVAISTFSLSCRATKDWRPYWDDFLMFIKARNFQLLQNP